MESHPTPITQTSSPCVPYNEGCSPSYSIEYERVRNYQNFIDSKVVTSKHKYHSRTQVKGKNIFFIEYLCESDVRTNH